MIERKWATPIAMATAITESEWKRQLEEASDAFKMWTIFYPHGTELDWSVYSGRQGIRSLPAKHIWKSRQNRRMVLAPNDEYQRVMEAQTSKMKDLKPVIKMVTPVAQVTEMATSEIKRQQDDLSQRKTEDSYTSNIVYNQTIALFRNLMMTRTPRLL